jgi:hypothetical protein
VQGQNASNLVEGEYVQVFGSFKGASVEEPNSLGAIFAYSFFPIEDHNQVSDLQLPWRMCHLMAQLLRQCCDACSTSSCIVVLLKLDPF